MSCISQDADRDSLDYSGLLVVADTVVVAFVVA